MRGETLEKSFGSLKCNSHANAKASRFPFARGRQKSQSKYYVQIRESRFLIILNQGPSMCTILTILTIILNQLEIQKDMLQEKDKVVNAEGVKKIFEQWKGPKKIINNDTNLGGFNYHDIIGILNSPQDDFFVEEINNWIDINS